MRRYDCHLPVSGASLVARLPDTLPASLRLWSPLRARVLVEAPRITPGPLVTRSPTPGMQQGDRWLSQVPELPLWTHAPLSAPGGVLPTRHTAPRTAAFRPVETVGVPLRTTGRDILLSTTLHFSGLYHAACVLATPGSIRPLAGRHAGSLLTGWLGVDQVGLERALAPTG